VPGWGIICFSSFGFGYWFSNAFSTKAWKTRKRKKEKEPHLRHGYGGLRKRKRRPRNCLSAFRIRPGKQNFQVPRKTAKMSIEV